MFRQGDVVIVQLDKEPATVGKLVPNENGRAVLAHGEATGHSHSFAGDVATLSRDSAVTAELSAELRKAGILADDWSVDASLSLATAAPLQHQEHFPITHDAGKYAVIRQREYSPEAIRRVAD
jgi:hypothetical protein